MSINKVVISGNLTQDPALRRTQSGMAILDLGMAVNDRRRDPQTGEWKDYANWVDCTMFGNRAEALANILTKGMKVAVEGKLRYESWEKDGQKRSKLKVIVDELDFMSSRNSGGSQGNSSGYQNGGYAPNGQSSSSTAAAAPAVSTAPTSSNYGAPQFTEVSSVYDDDIPF